MTGAIAGICQALLVCPLEVSWAQARNAQERQKSWWRLLREQLWERGSYSPQDRLRRAYHGVGLLAVREVVLNVSFFPLFAYLQRYQQEQYQYDVATTAATTTTTTSTTNPKTSTNNNNNKNTNLSVLLSSGVLAGAACAVAVFPVDMARLYYKYSGQRFSFWTGLSVAAPPFSLLFRAWTVQALVLGPAFGAVAAVYEWT